MSGVNVKRVILGGLAAGVFANITESVFNMVIMAQPLADALTALHLPPLGGDAIAFYVVWGFLQGFLSVWLYAAMRPRYGAGPGTAVRAGLLVWALAYVFPGLSNAVLHILPLKPTLISAAWALVEAPLVTLLGAWIYRED